MCSSGTLRVRGAAGFGRDLETASAIQLTFHQHPPPSRYSPFGPTAGRHFAAVRREITTMPGPCDKSAVCRGVRRG
jgi:hypothetical protein